MGSESYLLGFSERLRTPPSRGAKRLLLINLIPLLVDPLPDFLDELSKAHRAPSNSARSDVFVLGHVRVVLWISVVPEHFKTLKNEPVAVSLPLLVSQGPKLTKRLGSTAGHNQLDGVAGAMTSPRSWTFRRAEVSGAR